MKGEGCITAADSTDADGPQTVPPSTLGMIPAGRAAPPAMTPLQRFQFEA